ncbi:peptide chain release factor N(5)-glutamine methyltransferase [Pigmentiphaga soli]
MAGSGLETVDARALMAHVLGVNRAWLIAHGDDPLSPEAAARFDELAARRRAGEPVAYLVGEREFMGHRLQVSPDVLIPRPETELLVETALACVAGRAAPALLDLGTGSGAIAISLALARPDARVRATDLSAGALAVARANARRLDADVEFLHGDWLDALNPAQPAAIYDAIVANPPYIADGDRHLAEGDLRFEPRGALTDGADGLQALRAIAAGAGCWLKPGGWLWLEHGWDQAAAVRALLAGAGLSGVESRRDLAGIERISGGYL